MIAKEIFKLIYFENIEQYKSKIRKKIDEIEHHNLYKALEQCVKVKSGIDLDPDTCKCEEVFAEYIYKTKNHCNKEYMKTVIKFVILYRESLNILLGTKLNLDEDLDYSSLHIAEDSPDIANEFINEYLDVDNEFFGFNKEEAIELTMNFCQWMYDNNYTCSKLTLDINN